mgnify:FL=1
MHVKQNRRILRVLPLNFFYFAPQRCYMLVGIAKKNFSKTPHRVYPVAWAKNFGGKTFKGHISENIYRRTGSSQANSQGIYVRDVLRDERSDSRGYRDNRPRNIAPLTPCQTGSPHSIYFRFGSKWPLHRGPGPVKVSGSWDVCVSVKKSSLCVV